MHLCSISRRTDGPTEIMKAIVAVRIAWRQHCLEENWFLRIPDKTVKKWMTIPTLDGVQESPLDGGIQFYGRDIIGAEWDTPRLEYLAIGETIYPVLRLLDLFNGTALCPNGLTEDDWEWLRSGGSNALEAASTPAGQRLLLKDVSAKVDALAEKVAREIETEYLEMWKPLGFIDEKEFWELLEQ